MHGAAPTDSRTRSNTQGPNKLTPIIAVTANAMKGLAFVFSAVGLLSALLRPRSHAGRRLRGQRACLQHACMPTNMCHACMPTNDGCMTRTGDREKCIQAGMDDYISKPVERKRLEEVLSKWLVSDK